MNKLLRPVLVAVVAAVAIGTVLDLLGESVGVPDAGGASWTLAAALGILLFFLMRANASNRHATQADAQARERALAFPCPQDRAVVYFVRTGFAGKTVGVDLRVDGRTVAQIKSPRFTCVTLTPGSHTLEASVGDGRSSLAPGAAIMSTTMAAGSIVFLHVGLRRDLLKTSLVFEPWSIETAKVRLQKIGMVLPEVHATSTQ